VFRRRLKEIIARRAERGPILKRLRELVTSTEVLDAQQFSVKLREDISKAEAYVLILSPFLKTKPVKLFLDYEEVKKRVDEVKIVVVTKPAGEVYDKAEHEKCIETLRKGKIEVFEKEKLHFKAVIIDDKILYIGSINPLSVMIAEYLPEDYMLRFVSEALTTEVVEKAIGKENFEKYVAVE